MNAYRRIRPLFCDVLGQARSKYIPVERVSGATKHCITLFSQHTDKTMTAGAPGSYFFEGMPDMEHRFSMDEVRPGWDTGVGVVIGDVYYQGNLVPHAPRTVLRRAIDAWRARGLEPMVGIELEAYVMEPDGNGSWRPVSAPHAMTYSVGNLADPHGVVDEIMEAAHNSGFRLETVNSEYDSPQWEFTLEYTDALAACDEVFAFKQMAIEVVARRGLKLTFIGKPAAALAGSGLHVNFSARHGDGSNAFNDAAGAHGLADVARWSVGGLLDHHEALTAVCAPNVNAYKRLKPGQLAGVWANWGIDHRSATVRVPHERDRATRIEYRLPDGAANVYLATAAVLQAALLGIEAQAEPPAIEEGDALETANTDRKTPANLSAALDALEADTAFAAALGQELVDNFVALKRDEWAKFNDAVTDWELNYYVPYY